MLTRAGDQSLVQIGSNKPIVFQTLQNARHPPGPFASFSITRVTGLELEAVNQTIAALGTLLDQTAWMMELSRPDLTIRTGSRMDQVESQIGSLEQCLHAVAMMLFSLHDQPHVYRGRLSEPAELTEIRQGDDPYLD